MMSAILDCACGHGPHLVRRGGFCWYACRCCGAIGTKGQTIPQAAAAWNEERKEKERP